MVFATTHRIAGRMLVSTVIFLLLSGLNNLQATECCYPPDNLDYDCNKLPYGFDPYDLNGLQSLFGEPVKKCNGYWWTELTPEVQLNNCKIGKIIRKFELFNSSGRKDVCTQEVTLLGVHDYKIYFPKDASAYCEAPDPEQLLMEENGCDLLAVSKTDALFGTGSSGCYKILRTYKVINWCEYDGESPVVIIGRDEDCDGQGGDEGVWLIRRKTGTVFLDRDDDIYNSTPSAEENDCRSNDGFWIKSSQESRLNSTGFWQYTQHIKVFDDVRPEITPVTADPFCSYSNSCEANVTVGFNVSETCSADNLTIKVFFFENGVAVPLTEANNIAPQALSGSFPDYQLSGRYPLGDHLFEVHVRDGCGNTGLVEIPFSVVDCKAPTPVCYHGLSMTLTPQEANTDADDDGDIDQFANVVWVSDLLRSQSYDCTTPIKYSINRVGETPDPLRDNLVLTCGDPDTVRIEVYAWDSAMNPYAIQPDNSVGGPNYDHCETYITIREGICQEEQQLLPAMINGKVMTYSGMPVDQVEIQVTGSMQMLAMTDNEGGYQLNVMPYQQYFLTPRKEDDFLHGVNTADAIILTDHIMGVHPIDNPYQLIAADVNNSGNVSLFDLVHLRKAILGMIESFPNNQSWRFIPASHVFSDPANPWASPIPDREQVDDMPMPMRWANFYAVKIGDLDNSIAGDAGRSLADKTYLSIENLYLEEGQAHTFNITSSDARSLLGMQFELSFDQTQLVVENCKGGALSDAFLGKNRLGEGTLAVSWNSLSGLPGLGDSALFSLNIRAKQAGYLQDMLSLSQRRIKAEGYTGQREVRQMELQFKESLSPGSFRLDQNYPNPFREYTQIRFHIPEAGPVRLQVFDLTGRIIYTYSARLDAGEQTFSLSRTDLEQPAVLIYTLEVGAWRESRKMVLLP